MEKRIYDKKTGIHYELQGDYYLPCLELPEQPKVDIGIWGKRHLRYIKQHHKIRYTNLMTSCKLTAYLAAPHLRTLAKRREQADLSALASQYGAAFGGPIGAPAQPAKKAEYVERVYL